MTTTQVNLLTFKESDLLFDNEETRSILIFFFPEDAADIDTSEITTELRGFAQGLLIEAVDKSYAMGYMEMIFRAVCSPGKDMKKSLTKLGKKALAHWFKHATLHDLLHAKIYDSVRKEITRGFRSPFVLIRAHASRGGPTIAFVNYRTPSTPNHLWG